MVYSKYAIIYQPRFYEAKWNFSHGEKTVKNGERDEVTFISVVKRIFFDFNKRV